MMTLSRIVAELGAAGGAMAILGLEVAPVIAVVVGTLLPAVPIRPL